MSDLKALIRNRIKCSERSGASGEATLWKNALDRIEELESNQIAATNRALIQVGGHIQQNPKMSQLNKNIAANIILDKIADLGGVNLAEEVNKESIE